MMSENNSTVGIDELLAGIDSAVEAHLAWNQRLMRCSLLRESPGDDMLRPDAHLLCRFGVWLREHSESLQEYDKAVVARIYATHFAMHQAVTSMCQDVLVGSAASVNDLEAFQYNQSTMVHLLHTLRQAIAKLSLQQDVLTGLPLRHGLEHAYGQRSSDSARLGRALWLVMIDVDRFKSVNDNYGHAVGDQALRHIAQALARSLRDSDELIRYGGEEFLGMCSLADSERVTIIAQRMIDAVRSPPLQTDRGTILPLTATMGWAKVRPGEPLESALERADGALLFGKAGGRDQYVLAAV